MRSASKDAVNSTKVVFHSVISRFKRHFTERNTTLDLLLFSAISRLRRSNKRQVEMQNSTKSVRAVFYVALAVMVTSGCYLRPNLGPPGTIYDQRSRAVLSDPFPNNEIGPEVVGGRPRGYDLPLTQSTNIQASPYSELNKANRSPISRLRSPRYSPTQNFAPAPGTAPTFPNY